MASFVLDDAPWWPTGSPVRSAELIDGLESLALRISTIRERGERLRCHDGIWDATLVGDLTLVTLLYEKANPLALPRDLRQALSRLVDKLGADSIGDADLTAVEATINGANVLSPAAVFAAQEIARRRAVACVTPRCSERVGSLAVTLVGAPAAVAAMVHFVPEEAEQVAFFRDAVEVENADEDDFAALSAHAFPDLCFVDNLWRGLRDLKLPYRERRRVLVELLSNLNDHGARIFALPQHSWEPHFASQGVFITRETPDDMRAPCRKHRERTYRGEVLAFEWHIKIAPQHDRIHVHPGGGVSAGRVVVGIITKHLPLRSRGEC